MKRRLAGDPSALCIGPILQRIPRTPKQFHHHFRAAMPAVRVIAPVWKAEGLELEMRAKSRSDLISGVDYIGNSDLDWQTRIWSRMTGPGALYNAGNLLALVAGIGLGLHAQWGQSHIVQALHDHLMGSPDAAWLTLSMILFLISGEIYHRAGNPAARARLMPWADFISGLAAIALTVSLVSLGEATTAMVAGGMLTIGKLGSAGVLFLQRALRFDPVLRLIVVASRAPSLVALGLAVFPALYGSVPIEAVVLPLIMILCFLLWLWADLLLLRNP